MNAAEARDLTNKSKLSGLQDILDKIEIEANKGESKCYIYEHQTDLIERELRDKGFKVVTSCHRNEFLMTISW